MLGKFLICLSCILICFVCQAADNRFTVVAVDTDREKLQIFLNDQNGKPFKRIQKLAGWLKAQNRVLRFAMNAGMYHKNFSPVGLLVIDGKQISELNQANGRGNFFVKPNGVFMLTPSGPRVVETSEYPALSNSVSIATQSGPLLLRNGQIPTSLSKATSSTALRNGVGILKNKVFFVISEKQVTLPEFAYFFRDTLHCSDALYLDGKVSSLYSPEIGRSDSRANLGPIIGILR